MLFVDRRDEIELLHLALTAREHAILLGPPGTAKTAVVEEVARKSGLRFFKYQLNADTVPEEIFGPWDFTALKQGRYVHLVEGFLPDAEVAFLDEIGKANSLIRNSLLRIMNEREFAYSPPQFMKVPLISLFAASNEMLPEDQAAVWDRFLLRKTVSYVAPQGREKIFALLEGKGEEVPAWSPPTVAVENVVLSEDAKSVITQIYQALLREGIVISDRRLVKGAWLVRAAAAMEECEVAEPEHCAILRYVFWEKPDQERTVYNIVLNAVSPELADARQIVSDIEREYAGFSPSDPQKLGQLMVAINQAVGSLRRLQRRASPRFAPMIEELVGRVTSIKREVMETCGMGEV